jgi:four helix bundle protein
MKQGNIIQEKSFAYAVRIVKLFMHLRKSGVERTLSLQVLRSGTSIGANIEEAIGGASKRDFLNKLQVAYKEARETNYWLRLFSKSGLLQVKLADSFIADCNELIKILTSILNATRRSV